MRKNIVTSASIMTGMPATNMAIQYALEAQDNQSFGLHFNIVDNHRPLSRPLPYSLLNSNNAFLDSNKQRFKALLLNCAKHDISRELCAQIDVLAQSGVNISHVDSHGHLHKFPRVVKSMRPAIKRYAIKHIRIPQNIYPANTKLSKRIWNSIFSRHFKKLPTSDYFFMLEQHNDSNWLECFLDRLPDGITELGIHPGNKEEWRKFETAPFLQPNFKSLLKKYQIQLISFLQLKGVRHG